MDTRQPIQTNPVPETDTDRVLPMSPSRKWNAPVITRFDIRRTMNLNGTGVDEGAHTGQ
jgi:hypothetical protein